MKSFILKKMMTLKMDFDKLEIIYNNKIKY